jgi:simple sugar transport system substrate-binding protein
MLLTTRRSLLRSSLALPAAGALATRAAVAADPMLIGFVYVAPIGDAGWTFQHEQGRRAMDAALGDKIKSSYVENVAEGADAEHMSKSAVIGYVAAFPIPEVVQGINAFILGAQAVNPKTVVKVVWTSSWFDPGKERAAADTLISQGADLVTHHTDSTAVVQAGEEKGVYTIGYNSNMAKYGPKTCLTAVTMIWDSYYIDTAKAAVAGTWTSGDVWGGVKDGMVTLAPLNAAAPVDVAKDVIAKQSQIATGTLKPFAGPIKDQDGKIKVAAGASLSDKEILEMHWFADGVQGKL